MADDPSDPPPETSNQEEDGLSADVPPSEPPPPETIPELVQPPEEFRDESSAGEGQVAEPTAEEPEGDKGGSEPGGGTSIPEAASVDKMSTGDPTEEPNMEHEHDDGTEDGDTTQDDEDEAEFRAKYAIGIDDEEFNGEQSSILGEATDDDGLPTPTAAEMDAIIKYLQDEEEGEGDGEEEEEEGDQESPINIESTQGGGDGEPDASSVLVLGPEHPKMKRFQKALSEHLKRQIFEADCALRDLENDLKIRKKERTDLGTSLYSLQHDMLRKTEAVEKIDKDMEKLVEKRNRIEVETKVAKKELAQVKEEERLEQEKELSLRESVKTLDFTEHVVREAASKYEGEVKSRALVDEKIEKMRAKSEAEKRDQDFYLDKILTHVQHMELINSGIRRQIEAHRNEQKELQTYINEAVTEIEALQIEKMHLQRAWNETISVVRSRDEALDAARQELQKVNEAVRIKETEIRSLSKMILREQEAHEKSILLLRRRRVEERMLRSQLAQLEAQIEALQIQLSNLTKVKQTVEADLLRANNTLFKKQKEVAGPRRALEKLMREKVSLEDKILDILHEQSGLDKAAAHIRTLIRETRDKTRNMEAEVARVENENSLLAVEVERLRADLFRKTSLLNELESRVSAQEKVLAEQAKDIAQSERIIQRKTAEVEKLNRKLEKLLHQQGGVELGPVEVEIVDLEKQLTATKEEVNRLQAEWLKRQDDLVRLTNQRDSVLHQSELLRKEVFIMERKRQRLDSEVEAKKAEITKVRKNTETIRAEIATVNAKLHEDRSCHEQMDKDNLLIQAELVGLLKDAEEEARELESEIARLESEKISLIESLHSAHETNLAWEKKVHLAKELQQSMKKEQQGSTSALKMEIHHMQVRYQEVIRAQEKLMGDLERSIDRRERIIHRADMNLKKDQINPKHTKINIQRNFAQMKERNRLLLKEVGDIEGQVRDTMECIEDLENKLSEASNGLNKVREDIQNLETRIADASIQKHKNLIDLVLRQERYRILESMKYGRYKPTGKTLQEIERALNEVEGHAYALIDLSDTIAQEHPEAATHVKLVKASIAPSLTT